MDLALTEEHTLLQTTAREFLARNSSFRRLRTLRDSQDPLGYSRDLWKQMADLGWPGIIFPAEYGGSGLGHTHLMVVLEELGRGLVPEPIMSNVLFAGTAVLLAGSEAQRRAILPPMIAGDLLLAFAHQEAAGPRYDPHHVTTSATRDAAGWTLHGTKAPVLDGYGAERIVVSARVAGSPGDPVGVGLFLVDAHTPGVTLEPQHRIDGRNCAILHLDGVRVPADAALGATDAAGNLLQRVLDRATIGLAAEMLGSMLAALEMTLDYLRTRKQFGVAIGSFQALKHRAALMFTETELARSVVMAAHQAVDEDRDDVARLASLAKARCSDAFVLIGNETVQMHGGIGMTDEHDAGFFLKRARVAALTLGDAPFHRNRYAALSGY